MRKLPKTSFSLQKDIQKYHICRENKPDIVVKVGDIETIYPEYEISKHIQGFLPFTSYFEYSNLGLITMPYFELGNIGLYPWAPNNIHILRTCVKQTILAYINAFFHGYLHGDFHPGNVLLEKTDETEVLYHKVPTNGLRIWIMEFSKSRVIEPNNKKDLIDFYFDMEKFFILLQDYRYIGNINKATVIPVFTVVQNYVNDDVAYPNQDFIWDICKAIDEIHVFL